MEEGIRKIKVKITSKKPSEHYIVNKDNIHIIVDDIRDIDYTIRERNVWVLVDDLRTVLY